MKRVIFPVFLIVILTLTGCTEDDTNYFHTGDESILEKEIDLSWVEEKWNDFCKWFSEQLEQFEMDDHSEYLPDSVYDYDVEKDFPITRDNNKRKRKTIKEYWDDMWRDTEESE